MVTDAWVRSAQKINFPSEFIEGYAYLQSKFYGSKEGVFYGEKAQLWMPAGLLKTGSVELNYISARGDNKLMIAFCNQSNKNVATTMDLNAEKVIFDANKKYNVRIIADNNTETKVEIENGKLNINVSANGITTIIIEGISAKVEFQDDILAKTEGWKNGYYVSSDDKIRAMLLNFGKVSKTAYIYITEDDTKYSSVTLISKGVSITDAIYPYEFSIPVNESATSFEAEIFGKDLQGHTRSIGKVLLSK